MQKSTKTIDHGGFQLDVDAIERPTSFTSRDRQSAYSQTGSNCIERLAVSCSFIHRNIPGQVAPCKRKNRSTIMSYPVVKPCACNGPWPKQFWSRKESDRRNRIVSHQPRKRTQVYCSDDVLERLICRRHAIACNFFQTFLVSCLNEQRWRS